MRVIKNGVLTRCGVFLVGVERLMCWVVGLILFVSIGVLLLCDVVIMIFLDTRFFVAFRPMLLAMAL